MMNHILQNWEPNWESFVLEPAGVQLLVIFSMTKWWGGGYFLMDLHTYCLINTLAHVLYSKTSAGRMLK